MRALLPIPIARGTQHTTYAYIHNLIIIVSSRPRQIDRSKVS